MAVEGVSSAVREGASERAQGAPQPAQQQQQQGQRRAEESGGGEMRRSGWMGESLTVEERRRRRRERRQQQRVIKKERRRRRDARRRAGNVVRGNGDRCEQQRSDQGRNSNSSAGESGESAMRGGGAGLPRRRLRVLVGQLTRRVQQLQQQQRVQQQHPQQTEQQQRQQKQMQWRKRQQKQQSQPQKQQGRGGRPPPVSSCVSSSSSCVSSSSPSSCSASASSPTPQKLRQQHQQPQQQSQPQQQRAGPPPPVSSSSDHVSAAPPPTPLSQQQPMTGVVPAHRGAAQQQQVTQSGPRTHHQQQHQHQQRAAVISHQRGGGASGGGGVADGGVRQQQQLPQQRQQQPMQQLQHTGPPPPGSSVSSVASSSSQQQQLQPQQHRQQQHVAATDSYQGGSRCGGGGVAGGGVRRDAPVCEERQQQEVKQQHQQPYHSRRVPHQSAAAAPTPAQPSGEMAEEERWRQWDEKAGLLRQQLPLGNLVTNARANMGWGRLVDLDKEVEQEPSGEGQEWLQWYSNRWAIRVMAAAEGVGVIKKGVSRRSAGRGNGAGAGAPTSTPSPSVAPPTQQQHPAAGAADGAGGRYDVRGRWHAGARAALVRLSDIPSWKGPGAGKRRVGASQWLEDITSVAVLGQWSPEDALEVVARALPHGEPRRWFEGVRPELEKCPPHSRWDCFSRVFLREYEPQDMAKGHEAMGVFIGRLKQTTKESVDAFLERVQTAKEAVEHHRGYFGSRWASVVLEVFKKGLRREIRKTFLFRTPRSLRQAVEYARRVEQWPAEDPPSAQQQGKAAVAEVAVVGAESVSEKGSDRAEGGTVDVQAGAPGQTQSQSVTQEEAASAVECGVANMPEQPRAAAAVPAAAGPSPTPVLQQQVSQLGAGGQQYQPAQHFQLPRPGAPRRLDRRPPPRYASAPPPPFYQHMPLSQVPPQAGQGALQQLGVRYTPQPVVQSQQPRWPQQPLVLQQQQQRVQQRGVPPSAASSSYFSSASSFSSYSIATSSPEQPHPQSQISTNAQRVQQGATVAAVVGVDAEEEELNKMIEQKIEAAFQREQGAVAPVAAAEPPLDLPPPPQQPVQQGGQRAVQQPVVQQQPPPPPQPSPQQRAHQRLRQQMEEEIARWKEENQQQPVVQQQQPLPPQPSEQQLEQQILRLEEEMVRRMEAARQRRAAARPRQ